MIPKGIVQDFSQPSIPIGISLIRGFPQELKWDVGAEIAQRPLKDVQHERSLFTVFHVDPFSGKGEGRHTPKSLNL